MKYLLRLMVFLLRNLALVLVVGALLMICFTFAMDASSIYIVACDGMQMRAEVVLGIENQVELSKFFTLDAIEGDVLLRAGVYTDYTIRHCDYRPDVSWLWTWPWDTSAEVTLTEHIPVIDGELPVAKQTEEQRNTPGKIPPPGWQDAEYELTFAKIDGKWKISGVDRVRAVEPLATQAPRLTPEPSATASPAATPVVTPEPSQAP